MKLALARVMLFGVLGVFSLYLVPHEAVHLFYAHEDTEHGHTTGLTSEFSQKHIHCDFLSWYLSDYLPGKSSESTKYSEFRYCIYLPDSVTFLHVFQSAVANRGPPMI